MRGIKRFSVLLMLLVVGISEVAWSRGSCSESHLKSHLSLVQTVASQPRFIEDFELGSREQEIRKHIAARGLTIVTYNARDLREVKDGPHPQIITRENLEYFEEMFGAKIRLIDEGKTPPEPERIRGVVIHIGNSDWLRSHIVGDINITHVVKSMHRYRRVFDDKWQEYLLAEQVDPGSMPVTRNLVDIIGRSSAGQREFDLLREETKADLRRVLRSPSEESLKRLESNVSRLVQTAFQYFRSEYPQGSFVKFIREAATGDHGSPINTGMKEADVAQDFMNRIRFVVSEGAGRWKLDGTRFQDAILGDKWGASDNTKVNLINSLLLNPAELIVQEKLNIQKTSDNEMLEVRVNFVRGRGLSGHNRWSVDYVPEKIAAAIKFVNDFFDKAPAELRQLAGGADVVFLKDGTMKFIEFNFGSESGYMDVRGAPIEANQFFSNLLGRPTALIQKLERVHRGGLPEILKFFRSLEIMKSDVKNEDQSIEDLIYVDAFVYFRDRMLDEKQNPAVVARIMKQIYATEQHRLQNRPEVLKKWQAVYAFLLQNR